ncbi:yteA family sporulation protein [Bacillaceae bacterium]
MLTPEQLAHFRSLLLSEKEDLEAQLKTNDHFGTEGTLVKGSLGELASYDNHPADLGTETYEREKDIALNEHAEQRLKDVEHALAAIERGTYGICEVCGRPIPLERLEALPTATRCKEDAADTFVSQRRPVEEDILRPAFGEFEYDEQEANFYDAEDAWQEVERYGTSDTPFAYNDPDKLSFNEMFVEEGEPVGYVEPIEAFVATDMEGKHVDISNNWVHNEYEKMLDKAGVISVVGNLGLKGLTTFGEEEDSP